MIKRVSDILGAMIGLLVLSRGLLVGSVMIRRQMGHPCRSVRPGPGGMASLSG